MNFSSPNKADNITIQEATAFCAKMRKLGFRISDIHINESASGPSQASYLPISDIPEDQLDPTSEYNLIVFASGNWHNVAKLVLEWGDGKAQDFAEVAVNLAPGANPASLLLNIPGAGAAIQKLLDKA